MLSNVNIARELNKNIWIYNLKTDNIKGSSVNLTASSWAWRVSDGRKAIEGNEIVIPPHETVLVETEEVIHVSDKIAGTYHSKVGCVSLGLGHIGTTLDPNWCGNSLIALHNTRNKESKIKVGDTFVSLIFFYLNEKANSNGLNGANSSGRLDVLREIGAEDIPPELDQDWRYNATQIKSKCAECEGNDHKIKDFLNMVDPPQILEEVPVWKKLIKLLKWFSPLLIATIVYFIIGSTENQALKDHADKAAFPLLVGYFSVIINRLLK